MPGFASRLGGGGLSGEKQQELQGLGRFRLRPIESEILPRALQRDQPRDPEFTHHSVLSSPGTARIVHKSTNGPIDAINRSIIEPFVTLQELRRDYEIHGA